MAGETIIVAAIAGAGTIIAAGIALTGVTVTNLITRRLKERELLMEALQFLTGGTQKRSIGVALICKYAAEDQKLLSAASMIFIAQMLHLKDQGHADPRSDREIEIFNYRMMHQAVDRWRKDKKLQSGLENELDALPPVPSAAG